MTLRFFLAGAALIALAACSPTSVADYDPQVRHPLGVEMRSAQVTAGAGDFGRLIGVARDFQRRGEGVLTVSLVAADEADAGARAAATAIGQRLMAEGVPAQSIQLQLLVDPALAPGSVVFEYSRAAAVLPNCPDFSGAAGWKNGTSSNFGCSVQTNLGLMLSDPRDLASGSPYEGRDAARANDIYGKWVGGSETTSPPVQNWSTTSGGR